jgi:hypothetical protein
MEAVVLVGEVQLSFLEGFGLFHVDHLNASVRRRLDLSGILTPG